MKLIFLAFLIIFVSNQKILAQEKTRDRGIKNVPDTVLFTPKYRTGLEVGTSFMSNFNGGYGIENYFSPSLSYLPSPSLKLDLHATIGSVNLHKMSLYDYYNSTFPMTGINHYFGVSGQATYYLNDKLSLISVGFAEKMTELDPLSLKSKTNYGGSFTVGYKFNDKFSMQAGVEIQRFNDPWNVNPFMYNHGYIP